MLENAFNATIQHRLGGVRAPDALPLASTGRGRLARRRGCAGLRFAGGLAVLGIAAASGCGRLETAAGRAPGGDPRRRLLCFFGALALRFAPAAWETGNRAGEFLFLGLAFVVAYAAAWLLEPVKRIRRVGAGDRLRPRRGPRRRSHLGLAMGLPARQADSRPRRRQGNRLGAARLARWASAHLPGRRFAAPEADGRLLFTPGNLVAFTGQGPDIEDIVGEPDFPSWQRRILRNQNLRFVVADRRLIAKDNVRGYFFTVPGFGDNRLLPVGVVHKFARLPAARVYDSGRIVLFDLKDRP